MERNDGIHTFSLKTRSSYSEIQNIRVQNACIHGKHDRFSLNQNFCIADYKDKGVEIILQQSLTHPSWITLIVNPSSLLADAYCPTDLFRPTKAKIKQLKQRLCVILDAIGLDVHLKLFRLSRCDLTQDRDFNIETEVAPWLNVFQKSWLIPRYAAVPFPKGSELDEKWKGANQHAWTIANKSCALSVYDKTYELKKNATKSKSKRTSCVLNCGYLASASASYATKPRGTSSCWNCMKTKMHSWINSCTDCICPKTRSLLHLRRLWKSSMLRVFGKRPRKSCAGS